MTDFDLLREYSARRSDEAFATLARRYTNLVYSAALRQTSDPHVAEEIAQVVFIILARKASAMRPHVVLSGWLLRTTRFVALNTRRRELHRRQTEQEVMNMNDFPTETGAAWNRIAPILDEALDCLSQKDRDAVALRFFEGKSFGEIGRAFGVTEDSAQKRVSRALDKLRANLAKRGVLVPAALVVGAMSAEVVKAAPNHLAAAVTSAAISQATAGAAISVMAKTAIAALETARARMWALNGAGIAVTIIGLALVVHQFGAKRATSLAVASSAPVAVPQLVPAQASNLNPTPELLARADSSPTNSGKLLLRVLDSENGKPVEGVRLTLVWISDWPNRLTNVFSTDKQGEAVLPLDLTPVANWNIRVEVYKDGYVPKYVSWGKSQGDKIDELPSEFTTKLARGIEIGGVVRNENGEPIPDVQIVFSVMGAAPGASHERERLTMMGHYHTEITDSQGRWHCDHVPAQFRMITFEPRHADYMTAIFGIAVKGSTDDWGTVYLAESALLDGTAEMVLRRGLIVAGTVVDESGKPVAGAKIIKDRDWNNPLSNQETGVDGGFRFGDGSSKPMVLTVQADGFAPRDMTVQPGVRTAGISFALSTGAPLRVRVTSATGKPIANARIRFSADDKNRERFAWKAATDAGGILDWSPAPPEVEPYSVSAPGYESQSGLKWAADGAEHLVRLHKSKGASRTFRISGTVLDAETRQPISTFKVLTQNSFPQAGVAVRWSVDSGSAGKFSISLEDTVVYSVTEIRADGYWPVRLTNAIPVTADPRYDVALERATGLAGTVQLPDGTPVERATVVLQTESSASMRRPFDLEANSALDSTETDSAGRFAFQPRLGVGAIFAADKQGYARIPVDQFSSTNIVVLQPWGRVEGTLKIGSRPGAGETMELGNWYWPGSNPSGEPPSITLTTKTDEDGHFLFEGVPPGDMEIYHELNFRAGKLGAIPLTQGAWVQVRSGQTTQVTVGGTDRRVIGRIEVENPALHIDWRRDVQALTSKISGIENPDALASGELSPDEQNARRRRLIDFWRSPAGRKAQLALRHYVPVFETDGSFSVDDVLPGDYVLDVFISDPNVPDDVPGIFSNQKTIGTLHKEITVPAADDGGKPFDAGVFELELNHE